jgi:flagellar hook-associated protein 2
MDLGISGLASGFDWRSLIDQLSEVERAPERQLQTEQAALQQRNGAYGNILTQLTTLKTRVDALKDPALFSSRLARTGDPTVATASAAAGAAAGIYTFNVTQRATASVQQGTANAGLKLSATNNVSALLLSAAAFVSPIRAGTFTVNGKQVTIATSDSLQQVFEKIGTATGGTVTASYDNTTDKITFAGAGEIVLGSSADTSNFLEAAKLANNGTATVTSTAALGVIKTSAKLASANFATAISDGGAGAGQFKVNGVTINFNASTDTVNDVLARITNSAAGVTASYDSINDRFLLTNKTTGDLGVALEDVTGNFLAATQLSTGALAHGKNLLYTIDGGDQLSSQSNIITETSSAISGLSVTVLDEGETTVEVASDTNKIKTAITDFIAEYNKAQSLIDTQTASSTDSKGKVTAGILSGESDANDLASKLRSLVNAVASGLTGSITQLASLGIDSNGTDDTIKLTDTTKLDAALAGKLSDVKELFTNATSGLAVQASAFLDRTVGDSGSLVTKQTNLGKQILNIDTQVADLERLVLANQDRLTEQFVAMETARANFNQQLAFLNQNLGLK